MGLHGGGAEEELAEGVEEGTGLEEGHAGDCGGGFWRFVGVVVVGGGGGDGGRGGGGGE